METLLGVIALCTLLVMHVALAMLAVLQRVHEIELPVWLTALLLICLGSCRLAHLVDCRCDEELRMLRANPQSSAEQS